MSNPFSVYKKQSVTTMTPTEVIIKLYSELEKQLLLAIQYTEEKRYDEANKHYIKSQQAINILRESLDMKVEISKNLDSLYEFIYYETMQANLKKDPTSLKENINIITELRLAFTEINAMSKEQIASQQNSSLMQA